MNEPAESRPRDPSRRSRAPTSPGSRLSAAREETRSGNAWSRREWLSRVGTGLAGLALADLIGGPRRFAAAGDLGALAGRGAHHRPRARRVVELFMSGAASQCDLFDHKPLLARRAGERFDPGGKVELFQSDPGVVMPSPWRFRPRGECGRYLSDLVPHLGRCVDEIAFLHGMVSKSNVHGPATFLAATGFPTPGFPAAGAWVGHALGRETDELPTFVTLPDARGFAPNGPANWTAGFLDAEHQATVLRPGADPPIEALSPPPGSFVNDALDAASRDALRAMNRRHAASRAGDSRLEARVRAYELAARMQLSAPEALDVGGESPATRRLYGLDDPRTEDMGRRCLIARRLLERGVRYVQVWSGADNGFPRRNWDSHEDLARDHGEMGSGMDRPAAALLLDLKARGMLDDTLVHWTTEFGRMPCSQGGKGRDHNPFGFTVWLAGGGVRGGAAVGATDEWSFRATEPLDVHDVHATMLHLLGFDHEELTVRNDGIDRRLTDVAGRVLTSILA